ncbi:MAG: NAD-dependent epimerase/dehydratase family protein [Candidatus Hodarchaeota archaeon]
MGTKIAITGINSTLAFCILEKIIDDPRVEKIFGLDIRDYQGPPSPKVEFYKGDVRNREDMINITKDADVLIHTAFIVISNLPDNMQEIYDICIDGSRNAFRTAAESGVKRIIYSSSVAAYGMTKDTPEVLFEDTPLRGSLTKDFYYAYSKGTVEEYLDGFEKEYPNIKITRLRPHIIIGPNFVKRTSNLKILLKPLESKDKLILMVKPMHTKALEVQFTHENDLVKVIVHAIFNDLHGAYNIAGEPVNLTDFAKSLGKRVFYASYRFVSFLVKIYAKFSKKGVFLFAWLLALKKNLFMNCDKLLSTGITPSLISSKAAIEEALAIRKVEKQSK